MTRGFIDRSYKTGIVTQRDYDESVAKHIGATVQDYELNSKMVKSYVLNLPGMNDPIYVTFDNPDPTFAKKIVPYIVILCDFPEEARYRWESQAGLAYSVEDQDNHENEELLLPVAHDLNYTINAFMRTRRQKNLIQMHLLKKIKRTGTIRVKDSLTDETGIERIYPYEVVGGSDISELVDAAERYPAISRSFNVFGEFELTDEEKFNSAENIIINVNKTEDNES